MHPAFCPKEPLSDLLQPLSHQARSWGSTSAPPGREPLREPGCPEEAPEAKPCPFFSRASAAAQAFSHSVARWGLGIPSTTGLELSPRSYFSPWSSRKAWEKLGSSKAPGGLKTSPNKGPFLQHSFGLQGNARPGQPLHRCLPLTRARPGLMSPGLEELSSSWSLCSRAGRTPPSRYVLLESVAPLTGVGQGLLGASTEGPVPIRDYPGVPEALTGHCP